MKTPILLSIVTVLTVITASAQDGGSQNADRKPPKPSRLVLALDADKDRVISAAELAGSTAALAALDKNGDGQLTKDEFCAPRPHKTKQERQESEDGNDKPSAHRPPPPDPLAKALDADRDHVISAAELAAAPAELATLDKNNDGQLTKDEFAPPPPKRQHHGPDSSDGDDGGQQAGGQQGGPGGGQQRPGGRP